MRHFVVFVSTRPCRRKPTWRSQLWWLAKLVWCNVTWNLSIVLVKYNKPIGSSKTFIASTMSAICRGLEHCCGALLGSMLRLSKLERGHLGEGDTCLVLKSLNTFVFERFLKTSQSFCYIAPTHSTQKGL